MMKVAILGSRGIPGNYGGFETCAEQISVRLVERGHDVTVYCCKPYSSDGNKLYKGVKRVVLPTIRSKNLEKPLYALLSLIHISFTKTDIVLMLGVSASFFCFIPRLFGKKVVINIDGLEWQRKKWGRLASWYLKFSEKMAGVTANMVVTDAKWIRKYYRDTYGKDSMYIAYGADISYFPPGETLKKFGLKKDGYILYVSRFEPENNPLLVREAFDKILNPEKKLVMVGDAPFSDEYIDEIKNTENSSIIFTGYQFGDAYRELKSNAYLYIQATEVGGTHPALIEAMGAGNCVLANDVPEHREVLGNAGIFYKGKEDLKEKLLIIMQNESLVKEKGQMALKIVEKEYSWESIVDKYEQLFAKM
jgi:glycosyltransferase involved in cell wall biosynthesis